MRGDKVTVFAIPYAPNRDGKLRLDYPAAFGLAQMIGSFSPEFVFIEAVNGVKGQGADRSFTFGEGYGAVRMAFAAAGMVAARVGSGAWKGRAGLWGKDKAASIALAKALWPQHAGEFEQIRGKRDAKACEGRAEACLIARYGAAPEKPKKRAAWK